MTFFENFDTLQWWLFGIGAGALAIQLFYFFFFFIRVFLGGGRKNPTGSLSISVVTCAKNEAENLKQNLPLLLEQDYKEFEIIVVNDSSWDGTKEILDDFEEKHENVKVVHLDDEKHRQGGKKFALTLGIKAAKFEHLLLIDADCKPRSKNWIATMTQNFNEEKKIVLGFSPYENKRGLLNKLIRFDALSIGIQYLSFAKAGVPYMGVGRNMAYTKSMFFENGGFKAHLALVSGDDDLFVQQNATRKNTAVALEPEAQTVSVPKTSWKDWVKQKKRHFTTAPRYKFAHKILLTTYTGTYFIFLMACLLMLNYGIEKYLVLTLIVLRTLAYWAVAFGSANKLKQRDLGFVAPVYELLLNMLIPMILLSNFIIKPSKWN